MFNEELAAARERRDWSEVDRLEAEITRQAYLARMETREISASEPTTVLWAQLQSILAQVALFIRFS